MDYNKLIKFSAACGAEVPLWMRKSLEIHSDDASYVRKFGIEAVTKLCDNLLSGGVKGLHFYTLNHVEPTASIVTQLGLQKDPILPGLKADSVVN